MEEVKRITGGRGVDAVFDGVGKTLTLTRTLTPTLTLTVKSTKPNLSSLIL